MTSVYTSNFIGDDLVASVTEAKTGLTFGPKDDTVLHIAGLPEHVVKATAEAFNRAMRAEKKPDGSFVYHTDAGNFLISDNDFAPGWMWQHEDAERVPDGHGGMENAGHYGNARTFEEAMAEVDDCVAEILDDSNWRIVGDVLRTMQEDVA
ncbi:hypothetical protein ROJ8625_04125 [Roseivivax jejudonensis]|uniref:Uncharacterized protein n=1 Tax=Roseivivax jejudonensis TaxID=1529041 RepID=A0A1X7AB18_9RHOB|nr:hypothetical protein [Roseivivax jejudonensis]SLN74910.1 hypothetical protein ROJ8625_04125 [Roseivivax jejudonensis]